MTTDTDLTMPPAPDIDWREPLPFFVYGTLRPNNGNARMWTMRALPEGDGEAHALGMKLLGEGRGFPYMTPTGDPSDITFGCIIRPTPGNFDEVLEGFDMLEGFTAPTPTHTYGNHYERRQIIVQHRPTEWAMDGTTRCWTYLLLPIDQWDLDSLARLRPIEGGDWMKRDRSTRELRPV